jgi:hypothetical protein
VRLVYPIDPWADPNDGAVADPKKHYLLDTPVFDDISITYFTKPKILMYRVVFE